MLNIVVPMAGRGSRFTREGFRAPKPLIPIGDKPMIAHVLSCYPLDARYIFVVRSQHVPLGIREILLTLRPGALILEIDQVTDGPASSVLVAREFIDTDDELLIADCDSYLVWPHDWVLDWFRNRGATGGVPLWISSDPASSYAAVGPMNWITETREKDPFTQLATTGPYWWSRGADFCTAADAAIMRRATTNGEYYVSPLYNFHISRGGRVLGYLLSEFWPLGTPDDARRFETHFNQPRAASMSGGS